MKKKNYIIVRMFAKPWGGGLKALADMSAKNVGFFGTAPLNKHKQMLKKNHNEECWHKLSMPDVSTFLEHTKCSSKVKPVLIFYA